METLNNSLDDIRLKIDYLQRFILVHSYIYYELDNNVISDKEYDTVARKLSALRDEYPDLWKKSYYYKQFGDEYNGATGFTLFHDLNERQQAIIRYIALTILNKKKRRK